MTSQRQLVVPAEAHGLRLDQFLADAGLVGSRARGHALIEAGHVTLDGKPATKPSARLKAGQACGVTEPDLAPAKPLPEAIPLTRLYEDRDLVVVDKPAGLVVHPGAGHATGTLVNALLHHVDGLAGVGGEARPGIVHRLDRDTSGVLVVAKHDDALRALQAAFKARTVDKRYLALVYGQPPDETTYDTLYGRHATQRQRFSSKVKTGKRAVTHLRTLRRFGQAAEVELVLETGRTHQIRVHLADAGFPLLGDAVYGSRASAKLEVIPRQALHALRLEFDHPRTGKRLRFEAPVPADFVAARRALQAPKAR